MFLVQQILRCGSGRQAEAIKRLNWIHGQMADHHGSVGMIVAKYLGNPTDFLILRQWRDRAAFDEFMASPAGQFPQSKPPGIYDSLDVGHNWEEVLFTPGAAQGNFLWRSGYDVEDWDEFLKLRTDDDSFPQWIRMAERPGRAAGALVESRTFRNLDNDHEALTIMRLEDREAMEEIVASPSRAAIDARISGNATHPGRANAPRGPVYTDCFEVVDELVKG